MRRAIALLVLFLAACRPAHAQLTYTFDNNNSTGPFPDNMAGLHLNRSHGDTFAHGISWDIDGVQQWNAGLDCTLNYSYPGVSPTPPDLVLAYRPFFQTDNFRMRWDDCRLWLGQIVGHPTDLFQFRLDAGTQSAPLGGLMVGTYGYQHGLYLWNMGDTQLNPQKRTSLNFYNLYMMQTDTTGKGAQDFWLYNYAAGSPTYWVGSDNSFQLDSPKEGFFGQTPVARPSVTGSWSDGTAAKNVLAALVQLGLVTDNTTP